uniref:F-box domain-containing protein n=1 Tax=Aegilops tauschii TaxID=37682 RepID=N1R271_AEGTA
MAMRDGLILANTMGFNRVEVESDSLSVVNYCQGQNRRRGWSDLDDRPAGLIAERVLAYDAADYLRFRAVCRAWRQCCTEPRSHGGIDHRFHPWRWVLLREPLAAPNRRCFLNSSTGQVIPQHPPPSLLPTVVAS